MTGGGWNIDKYGTHSIMHTELLHSVLVISFLVRVAAACSLVSIIVWILKYGKICVESHSQVIMFFYSAPRRYRYLKEPGSCSVVLLFGFTQLSERQAPCQSTPLLWTQATRLPLISVPQCIISKYSDLYIKIHTTTTYSGQDPLKASVQCWIKSTDRMMDNPNMRAGPGSVH